MKKKILVTASTFPRWEGDTEPRFILDLCKAMNEFFDVTVLAPSCPNAKEQEVLEGVKVIRYHYFPIHKWETLCYPGAIIPRIKEKKIRGLLVPFLFIGLWRKLLLELPKYDLVHANWIIPQGIIQSMFSKPYIVTGHGGDVMELNGGIFKALKKRCLNKAKYVTVVSEKAKKTLNSIYGTEHVKVQSMGCDVDRFNPQKRIENYFNQEDKKVILFVGRFVEIKGITYLIEAMKKIDALLVIVGKGPDEEKIKKQAEGCKEKVLFMGPQDHSVLPTIYASSDIFIIPSITLAGGVTEGAPTVITEAMASGLPVIGTNTGGIPELISDGENGLIIKEKNSEDIVEKVNFLINNPEIYQKMALKARKMGEQKSYKNVAKAFYDLIETI